MRRMIQMTILFVALTGFARGASITVLNPGFEDLVLSGPGGADNFVSDIPSWNILGQAFTFKPGAVQFPGGVPEGVNVGAVGNPDDGPGTISQILSATIQPNTLYTLIVDVGQRADFPLVSYSASLLAGGVTLASSSSPTPSPGTFVTDTVIFNSGPNPAQLGQNIAIQLSAAGSGQVDFDNVRLSATTSASAVPEPASMVMGATSVLIGLCYWVRRRMRAIA